MLCWALRNERWDAIPLLIGAGLDPSIADDDGRTALHLAVERADAEHLETVWALVRADAAVDARDLTGGTPLDDALLRREEGLRRDLAALLLHAGAPVHELGAFPCGDAKLDADLRERGAIERADLAADFERAVDAVIDGDEATLRALLEREPGLIRARSHCAHRATLLHYVAANGVEDHRQRTPPNAPAILRTLLDAGAEVDALAGSYGDGPVQTTLSLLVSSSWPTEAGLSGELTRMLCEAGAATNGLDDDGAPMATAVGFGQKDAVEALAAFARVDNPLFAAAVDDRERMERMIVSAERVDDTVRHCPVPWLGMSRDPVVLVRQTLECAVNFGRLEIARRLVELGVDPSAPATERSAPLLHQASYLGRLELVAYLLELGADPNARDAEHDATAIGWALEGGREDVVRLLAANVELGIDDACLVGDEARVRALLDDDPALVHGPDRKGGPLRVASYRGHEAVVRLLLERGADPARTNDRGRAALDCARAAKHAAIVALLEAASEP